MLILESIITERKAEHDIVCKLKVLNHASESGNIVKTYCYFGIFREAFYSWKRAYKAGENGALINNNPCPENHKLHLPRSIEKEITHLRTTYHFGPDLIVWHLQHYHVINISRNNCYQNA